MLAAIAGEVAAPGRGRLGGPRVGAGWRARATTPAVGPRARSGFAMHVCPPEARGRPAAHDDRPPNRRVVTPPCSSADVSPTTTRRGRRRRSPGRGRAAADDAAQSSPRPSTPRPTIRSLRGRSWSGASARRSAAATQGVDARRRVGLPARPAAPAGRGLRVAPAGRNPIARCRSRPAGAVVGSGAGATTIVCVGRRRGLMAPRSRLRGRVVDAPAGSALASTAPASSAPRSGLRPTERGDRRPSPTRRATATRWPAAAVRRPRPATESRCGGPGGRSSRRRRERPCPGPARGAACRRRRRSVGLARRSDVRRQSSGRPVALPGRRRVAGRVPPDTPATGTASAVPRPSGAAAAAVSAVGARLPDDVSHPCRLVAHAVPGHHPRRGVARVRVAVAVAAGRAASGCGCTSASR